MFDAVATEHILLESADPEPEVIADRVGALRVYLTLHNRIRRVRTELRIYQEGYLGICEQRAGSEESEQRFALRHLDPRPVLSCRVAKTARGAALCSIVVAVLMAGLAYQSVAPAITLSAAAAALITAALAATVFVYRTEERVQFVTRHGRIAVVTLVASCGCVRACRRLVPELVAAIKESASHAGGDQNGYLRAEVREHYRLRDNGVLSARDCFSAVQRILGRFD
jgi:hypothetical protein